MKTGIELIAEERWEQVYKHGFDLEHDLGHDDGMLAVEAAILTLNHLEQTVCDDRGNVLKDEWNLIKADTIHNLKVAATLIAAEIDRIQNQ